MTSTPTPAIEERVNAIVLEGRYRKDMIADLLSLIATIRNSEKEKTISQCLRYYETFQEMWLGYRGSKTWAEFFDGELAKKSTETITGARSTAEKGKE
jgi:hypothetical protein